MRKILKYILLAFLSVELLLGNANSIYGVSASLSGPSTVRAGDTITLNLMISDSGKYGLEGTLVYDVSQVSLSSISTNLPGWKVENNGNVIILYDDAMSNPLSGNKTVLTFKFKVSKEVATGAQINISLDGIITTDGINENHIGSASYSKTVAKPLSTNANLASLSVTGSTLSPTFMAGTTSYSVGEVEYSTSKLDIKYTTEDPASKVEVKGNSLSVGNNTVSIVVTAEDGTEKIYMITVSRKQDPNYKASSDANLKDMTISCGMVSPKFSSDVTDYIVYLPHECLGERFTATGTAADSKASGIADGIIDKLVEGKNQTIVVCKAEDGTEKSYMLTVVVMPKYEGKVPVIGEEVEEEEDVSTENSSDTEISSEPSWETSSEEFSEMLDTESDTEVDKNVDNEPESNIFVTILVVLVVIGVIGAFVYVLFSNRFKNKVDETK